MVDDIVRAYGFLTLGTRLKRIGERLQIESARLADGLGARVQTSHYPFLAALAVNGPLPLGDLAAAVGITQPGATRAVGQLVRLGLLATDTSPEDGRLRIVSLTEKGEEQVDFGKQVVWPRIEAAVRELCAELDGPLLDQLTSIEDGLAALPLDRRGRKGTTE